MSMQMTIVFLLAAGFSLVCVEVFIPGGVIGAAGGLLLVAGVVLSFLHFPEAAVWILLGVLVLGSLLFAWWVRFFPKSAVGRRLTLSESERGFQSGRARLADCVGRSGTAVSSLRPAGIVQVDGRRIDAITEGGMIEAGQSVTVINAQANRLVVRAAARTEHKEGNP